MKDPFAPVHPGEILRDEYMAIQGWDAATLAQKLEVKTCTIEDIINEKANVTPDISNRLGELFDIDKGYWLRLQEGYESEIAQGYPNKPKQRIDLSLFKNRQEAMLAMFPLMDSNSSLSRVHIQKLLFLLDRENVGEPLFKFYPHMFGAFDEEVYKVLESLQSDGNVKTISSGQAGKKQRRYILTKKGSKIGEECLNRLPADAVDYIKKTVEWVSQSDFGNLVETLYEMYPETQENSIYENTTEKFASNNKVNRQLLVFDRILHRRKNLYNRLSDEEYA